MRVKDGFVLRNMGGQPVVVSVGSGTKIFNGMVKLNETGEFLWKQLKDNETEEDLVKAVLDKYDVSEEIARNDVYDFITALKTPGIIE